MKDFMKRLFLLIPAIFFLFSRCTDEAEISPQGFPFIMIEEILVHNDEGATFSATLHKLPSEKIVEYGFVWSKGEESDPSIDDLKILNDNDLNENHFKLKITNGLETDSVYNVRAYIKTDNYEVYSTIETFVSQGTLPLKIEEFSPVEGYAGQSVHIKVDNISDDIENIEVKFGGIPATIDSIANQIIYVKSPHIPENTDIHISVTHLENYAISNRTFKVFYAWLRKDNFPGNPKTNALALSTDQKGYLIGGLDFNTDFPYGNSHRVLYEFDPTNDSWIKKNDLPFPAYHRRSGFVLNNNLYVYSNQDNAFYIYNSKSDEWALETVFPGSDFSMITFTINNEAFVGSTWYKSFFKYSPDSKQWTEISSFPGAGRFEAISYTFKGKGFVGLGRSQDSDTNDFYSYDPINNTWDFSSSFPSEQRSGAVSFMYNNKIYVGLGSNNDSSDKTYNDIWEYQVSENRWIKKDDYGGEGLVNAISFSIKGRAFVGTGASSRLSGGFVNYNNDFWEFNLKPDN